MGFVLEPEGALRLIDKDPRNKDVLYPYLNGEDLNSRPDQSPSRWVINFHDWPLNRTGEGCWADAEQENRKEWLRTGLVPRDYPGTVAADYPDCLRIVEDRVKPERLLNNDEGARNHWWRFLRPRPELYAIIASLERVLVGVRVTKHMCFTFARPGIVFADSTFVLVLGGWIEFAVVQSSHHDYWARTWSSSLETRLRYAPDDCYESFAFPGGLIGLHSVGERYYLWRQQVMLARQEGLTATYNRLHNPDESAEDIRTLRALHVEMDHAVAAAYGWTDLVLGHNFHQTKQGIRYTIAEPARHAILDRLLKLNHERYAAELASGLHEKGAKAKKTRKKGETEHVRTLFS
jgi:hypothetical protein